MITICIPIYNQDVTQLVDTIVNQCEKSGEQFQVLCFDDCSQKEYKEINKDLGLKFNVNYTELSENVGRSKIRNKMARISRYDFILFLDGDTGIEQDDFIQNYIDLIFKYSVVYGGRIYQSNSPDLKYKLHWNYGRKVESISLKKRALHPYSSFLTNNFMATAKIMREYPFDESLDSYGYEDLEWAERLQKSKVFIHHINNPTIHLGLEENEIFVDKTEKSIVNLSQLYKSKKITDSRLINFAKKIDIIGLQSLFQWWFGRNKIMLKSRLSSGQGSIRQLQLYKLGLFLENN